MVIAAADPAKITVGGDIKYHLWSSTSAVITLVNDTGDIDSTQTTITVDSTAYLKVDHVVVIDSEQMLITGVNSGTVIAVTRGVNDSTAATHSDNDEVKLAARFRIFERKGLKIVANSRGVEETATDGTGTPDTGTNTPTTTNNFTYVTTE
jgi:hypothetical protein